MSTFRQRITVTLNGRPLVGFPLERQTPITTGSVLPCFVAPSVAVTTTATDLVNTAGGTIPVSTLVLRAQASIVLALWGQATTGAEKITVLSQGLVVWLNDSTVQDTRTAQAFAETSTALVDVAAITGPGVLV